MTRRAVIFDVDGTLAETEELHRRAFNETFAEQGLGWHWDRDLYERLLKTAGGKERMQAYRDEIGAGADGLCPDDARIAALHRLKTDRYAALLEGAITLRPGIDEAIAACRVTELRLAIATTTSRSNVEALCRTCWRRPADQLFEVIASGDEVTAKKPDPAIYLLALRRLGLPPGDVIAVEDSAIGLASARAAGLECVVTPATYTAGQDFAGAAAVLHGSALADALTGG